MMTSPNSSRGVTLVGELGLAVQGSSSLKIKGAAEVLQPYKDFFSPKIEMSSSDNKVWLNNHSDN